MKVLFTIMCWLLIIFSTLIQSGCSEKENVILYFSGGLEPIEIGDSYGFIDKTGSIVISPQFDDIHPFSNGLAAVQVFSKDKGKYKGKWGYIDNSGKFVIQPQFDYAARFNEGLAHVLVGGKDGKCGYIDKTGRLVINPQFDGARPFREGLARVKIGGKDGKWGYIDKLGQYVINPQFDQEDLVSVEYLNYLDDHHEFYYFY